MLNFSKAVELFHGSTFGGGHGLPIWLTKLVCNGTENSLFQCKNAIKHLGNTGCSHAQDAGVQCAEDGELLQVNADTRLKMIIFTEFNMEREVVNAQSYPNSR